MIMTVPRDIVIKQKYIDALTLFQQKIIEIEENAKEIMFAMKG